MNSSWIEGTAAERDFVSARGESIVRKATKTEDMNEHWDYLDSEFGRVDVKSAKRLHRGGPVDYTIWWELLTVKRPPDNKPKKGWGVPNNIDRLIAIRTEDMFVMVNPADIYPKLKVLCKGHGRGAFLLHGRPNRGDLMTILPLSFLNENAVGTVKLRGIVCT